MNKIIKTCDGCDSEIFEDYDERYICPHCHKEFCYYCWVKMDVCEHCGTEVAINFEVVGVD